MKRANTDHMILFLGLHIVSLSLVLISSVSECYFLLGYLAITLMILSGVWLARAEPELFWTALYFIFALYSTVLISIFVEHGIYLWEIERWSHASGVTVIAWYQVLLVMTGLLLSYRAIDIVKIEFYSFPSVIRMGVEQLIRVVALLMIVILIGIATLYGTPNSQGVHRMDYWAYYAPAWGGAVAYWLIQLAFPFGYMYSKKRRKIDIIFFILILSVSFLMGARFTGLILSCFFFFLPIAVLKKINPLSFIFSWRGLGVFCVMSFLLAIALLKSYSVPIGQAFEMILSRAGVQAQMWWALNEVVGSNQLALKDIIEHYFGLWTESESSGVYYLMNQVAPAQIVNYRIETGSAFTMSGVINNNYFFGYGFGSFVNILYGAVFGMTCGLLKKAINSQNLIASLFSFKLMYKLMVVLLTGSTDQIFTWGNLAFLIIASVFIKLSGLKYEYQCR